MASVDTTVQILFTAVDQTAAGFRSIGQNVSSFAGSLEGATQPLANLAKSIELAETAVLGIGVAFGVTSLNNFAKFQSAAIDLDKVLDDTDGGLQQYVTRAKEYSLQYGENASVVLQGISDFKQAGFTAQEAANLQKDALDLVIAGGVDAGNASAYLVRMLKGFDEQATESARYVEALNAVSNKYATDVTQLAEGMARISPIAKTMGFSFEETTGLLTPIIEVFGSGSEAADGLKTGLLKLIDDSKPVADALATIGVSQKNANGELRSGKDIFYDVSTAFQSLSENQKLFVTQQLVGIEQAPRMVKVFDDLAKVQAITNTAMEHGNTVAIEREKRLNSLEVAVKRNTESWRLLSIEVGDQLNQGAVKSENALSGLAQALTKTVSLKDDLGNNISPLKPLIDGVNAAELGFARFIDQIAKNLPEALSKVKFDGLLSAFGNLGGQFAGIFSGVDVNSADGLARTIQFLVDSLASLTTVSAGVVNGLTPLGQTLITTLEVFNKSPDAVKEFAGSVIGVGQGVNAIAGFVRDFGGAITGLGNSLSLISSISLVKNLDDFLNVLNKIPGPLGAVAGLLGNAGLVGAAGSAGYALGGVLNDGINKAVTSLSGSQNTLGTWIFDLIHGGDAAVGAGDKLQKFDKDLQAVEKTTGLSIKTQEEFDRAINTGQIVFDEASKTWVKAGTAIKDFGDQASASADLTTAWITAGNQVSAALGIIDESANETKTTFNTLAEAEAELIKHTEDFATQSIVYKDGVYELTQAHKTLADAEYIVDDAHKSVTESTKKIAEETDKLTERQKIALQYTHELELKLLDLASNERIKSMEFTANIKIADIQAQADMVVAAFDSIGQAITATQAAEAEIFSSLGGFLANDKIRGLDKYFLKDYAMEQQKQAQEALDIQRDLVDAQIRSMDARTDAMNRGDALIKINADDLAPELQLVLRSLLEHIQIQANAEGLELLV